MERLTIDEAIEKARSNENIFKNNHKLNLTLKKRSPYYGLDCFKIANDNKRLAEWLEELKEYRQLEEQGRLIKLPCKVGDTVYLIDRDENNKFKVYKGKWKRVSLVQTSKDGLFNLRGEIPYDIYDCFYDDGRIMKHGMYVGQEHTKIGEVVFLTKSEAEAKLKELRGRE